MLSRDDGIKLLNRYIKTENLIKHSFAVEAILKETAIKINKNEELWAITGLVRCNT